MATGKTLQELQGMGAKPATPTGGGLTLQQLQSMQTPAEPNYFQRVGSSFQNTAQDITSGIQKGAESYQSGTSKGTFGGVLQATGGLIRSGLRAAGGVASAAFAPITEAPLVKPLIEKVGQKILSAPGVNDVVTRATELAKAHPESAKDIQNIIDIVSLGTGKAVEAPLAAEGRAIGRDIAAGAKAVLSPSEEAVQSKVIALFNKSIKPTTKKSLGQAQKYENDTLTALKTIKKNADNLNIEGLDGELVTGRAPQSINELAQGLDQTKSMVFKQYDDLAKQANGLGAKIEAAPIAEEVGKVAQNKALQLTNPEVIKYAQDWETRLKDFGTLDTETTQEVIKIMNNNLQSFYKNPSYDAASKVAIDAGIANNFRQALDKAIEGATGQEYQALKNQYSALKAIENDVTRAAMRDARKNVKGLLDYSDIFTSGNMINGILSLNPAMFTKGAVERGIKEYIKFLNDPNRAVKNIFEKLNVETGAEFKPASATGKFLQKPKLGASIDAITPESVAAKVDARDLDLIRGYLKGDIKSYQKAQPMIKAMQLQGMEDSTLQRFFKEVIDLNTKKLPVKSVKKP